MSGDLSKLSDEYVQREWAAIVQQLERPVRRRPWPERMLELFGRTAICWAVPTVPPPYYL